MKLGTDWKTSRPLLWRNNTRISQIGWKLRGSSAFAHKILGFIELHAHLVYSFDDLLLGKVRVKSTPVGANDKP
jgi:hypothetical protein